MSPGRLQSFIRVAATSDQAYSVAITRSSSAAATVAGGAVVAQLKFVFVGAFVGAQEWEEPVVTRRIFTLEAAAFNLQVTLSMFDDVMVFRS